LPEELAREDFGKRKVKQKYHKKSQNAQPDKRGRNERKRVRGKRYGLKNPTQKKKRPVRGIEDSLTGTDNLRNPQNY